ncbi:hypothetical protein, partial [Acinetobacter baumannii]
IIFLCVCFRFVLLGGRLAVLFVLYCWRVLGFLFVVVFGAFFGVVAFVCLWGFVVVLSFQQY